MGGSSNIFQGKSHKNCHTFELFDCVVVDFPKNGHHLVIPQHFSRISFLEARKKIEDDGSFGPNNHGSGKRMKIGTFGDKTEDLAETVDVFFHVYANFTSV